MKMTAVAAGFALIALGATTVHAQDAGVTLPEYSEIRLPNGMQVLLMERHDVPLVAFHARIRGGHVAEAREKLGAAGVLSELLQRGAGKRDARQFSDTVDGVGGIINTTATREAIVVSGEFLSRDRDLMLALLSDVLRRPLLSRDEFTKVREREIQSLAAARDGDPSRLMASYFNSFLYGSHPYGQQVNESTLAALTFEDIRSYMKNHVGADRTVLAIVGDFDTSRMEKAVRTAFGSWEKAARPAPAITPAKPLKGRRVLLVDKPDATQTYFWIGNIGVARTDPDRVALDLANTAFGGRFTSMLNTALRVKTGLTYGARSSNIQSVTPGTVAISSFTKTETTGRAIDMSIDLLRDLRRTGLDDATARSVKAYVKGQFAPALETGTQLADRISEIAFYGLDRSDVDRYFQAVDRANLPELKRVIERVYPDPDHLTFVLVGNADAIRETAKKYGPVTEMKITDPSFTPAVQEPKP